MPGQLERTARELLSALDMLDVERLLQLMAEDAQGVDEISRRWMRGRDEIEGYLRQVAAAITDIRTEIRDVDEREWGDTGVLTCWFEQDYTLEGVRQHISAPTTIVFRREGGAWKVALLHSIPLAEAA